MEARFEERAIFAAVLGGTEDVECAVLHARACVGAFVEGDFARGFNDSVHAGSRDLVPEKLAAEISCNDLSFVIIKNTWLHGPCGPTRLAYLR